MKDVPSLSSSPGYVDYVLKQGLITSVVIVVNCHLIVSRDTKGFPRGLLWGQHLSHGGFQR